MIPISFPSYPDCTECPLAASAFSGGLPTRLSDFPPANNGKALLVIGEAPGYQEDNKKTSWIGPSGQLLHKMLTASGIETFCDIYLSNACRCRPLQGTAPSASQIRICYNHLRLDIQKLYACYDGNLTILCAGASATRAILSSALKVAFSGQGDNVLFPHPSDPDAPPIKIPVFATYHPAAVLHSGRGKPGRSLLPVVRDHMTLVARSLGGETYTPQTPFEIGTPCPQPPPTLVAVDIETYGALAKHEQTAFHPVRSIHIDQVSKAELIQTVSFSWLDDQGTEKTTVFDWQNKGHRMIVEAFFGRLAEPSAQKTTLVGQNLTFDLMYLRHVSPYLHHIITPANFDLEDIQLWNFLHNELRPERGLKALARLFALARYGDTSFNYTRSDDPRLMAYNALDTQVTLRARALLLKAIAADYGSDSPKLSDLCRHHCSDILWACLQMSEAGVPYKTSQLQALRDHHEKILDTTIAQASEDYDLTLQGKGSGGSTQLLIEAALENVHLRHDRRVLLTAKTRRVSTSDANLRLLFASDLNPFYRDQLVMLQTFRTSQKLLSSYLRPLLLNPLKGIVHHRLPDVGMAYPTWYPCPSRHDLDDTSDGGQMQGRLSCKRPAFATNPPEIKACRTSRFPSGGFFAADYDQVEWRVAGLLSGDPVLMMEFTEGQDPHAIRGAMAYAICLHTDADAFFALAPDDPTRHLFRQMGKTINFLSLYGGQAGRLAATIRQDVGYLITDAQAQRILDSINARYTHLRQWQEGLLALTAKTGRVSVLTGWTRTFLGGEKAIADNRPVVLNFPVQTIAAQLLQSAQVPISAEFVERNLHAVIDMNIYDAIHVDTPPHERTSVLAILAKHLPQPPLLIELAKRLGRTIPLTYTIEEK